MRAAMASSASGEVPIIVVLGPDTVWGPPGRIVVVTGSGRDGFWSTIFCMAR